MTTPEVAAATPSPLPEEPFPGNRSVSKLPSQTPLADLMEMLRLGTPMTILRNRCGEPVLIADEGVAPGVLSRALAAARMTVRPEAVLTSHQVEQAIYQHF